MSKEINDTAMKNELLQNHGTTIDYQDHAQVVDEVIVNFRKIIEKDAEQNLSLKKWFFRICCTILVLLTAALIGALYVLLFHGIPNNTAPFAVEIVSIVSAFVAAFMTLMKIITHNLFTTKTLQSIVKIMAQVNDKL